MALSKQSFSGRKGSEEAHVPAQPLMSAEELLSRPIDELMANLNTSSAGLSSEEAARRLEVYGRNELAKKKKRAAIINFLSRFKSPLVIILMIAGAI